MESEEGRPAAPPIAATAEKRLQSVVDIVRDTAEQLRDKIAELPMPPAPPAMAFVTAAVPARQPIARRAQRLVFPPPPPAGPIARRAHRLTRD